MADDQDPQDLKRQHQVAEHIRKIIADLAAVFRAGAIDGLDDEEQLPMTHISKMAMGSYNYGG